MRNISLIKNILFSNFKSLCSPYKITFILTYRCNLKCEICKIWQTCYIKEELNIKEIEKIFKSLPNLGWLDLTGGEITLREDLTEIVKIILNNAHKLAILHISTNGQLPDKVLSLAKQALKFNVIPVINIGVDGPQKINDSLKGLNGAYLRSLETFKLLRSSLKRGHYYLSCTISNFNIGHLNEFIAELKQDIPSFCLSDLHFNIFHNSFHYYRNQDINGFSDIKFDKIRAYLFQCVKGNPVKVFLENRYIRELARFLEGNKFPKKCQSLRSTCFISPYGEVYPCGMYNRVVGNLKKNNYNLNAVWNGLDARKIKEEIKQNTCPGCWSPCEAYPAILGSILRN